MVNSVEKELRDSVRIVGILTSADQQPPTEPLTAHAAAIQRQDDKKDTANYDILVKKFIRTLDADKPSFGHRVAICGITLLLLALIGGFFMFLMRQIQILVDQWKFLLSLDLIFAL